MQIIALALAVFVWSTVVAGIFVFKTLPWYMFLIASVGPMMTTPWKNSVHQSIATWSEQVPGGLVALVPVGVAGGVLAAFH